MTDKDEYPFNGNPAKLFPMTSPNEQCQTSVLLAVLVAVPELAKQLLETIGQKTGKQPSIKTFTEIRFKKRELKKDQPDGLIVVTKRKNSEWRALLEVKTKIKKLDAGQIERYLQTAKTEKMDALITISNQLVARPDHNPVEVRKKHGLKLFHWSWKFIQTEAKLLQNREVFDKRSCEAYILDEFIKFLNNKSVGISGIDGMPKQSWKKLLDTAVGQGVIRKDSPEVHDVVSTWYSEVRDLQLQLCQNLRLPTDKVNIKMSKKHISDPKERLKYGCQHLLNTNELEAEFKIDNAASGLKVIVNINKKAIIVSMVLDAPRDKTTGYSRVRWLLKQFEKMEQSNKKGTSVIRIDKLSVVIYFENRPQGKLYELKKLIGQTDIKDFNKSPLPRKFEIFYVYNDQGKFSNSKEFIVMLEKSVHGFYNGVGCHLSKWTQPAPKPSELLVEDKSSATV